MAMQRIPFPTQTYELNSLPADAQDLVNLYAEPAPPEARAQVIVKSTPGLVELFDFTAGPIRALDASQPGRLYAVSGDQFIRYTAEGGAVSIGTVGATGRPTIAVGPTSVVVCVPPNAWVASHNAADPLHLITGTVEQPFPGASSVAYINGYWVFTADEIGADQFFWSDLLNADNYDGLAFASADARPNVLKRGMFYRGELWLFGETGAEVWYNTGSSAAPFQRRAGGDIPFGTANAATISECDNSLMWLGTNGIIYRNNGYTAERISTFAIEEWIRDYADVQYASALSYVQTGHYFYALSFERADGSDGRTWVYDAATRCWHRRASDPGGAGRWRADCSTLFGGTAVFGDRKTSVVFALDPLTRTDNGVMLRRVACFPPLWAETRRAFMSRLEIEMDSGTQDVNPSVQVDWSDNGGRTYSTPRFLDSGAPGQHRKRVFTTRLGSFRQRVLRLQAEDIVTFYGADADIVAGEN